MRLAGVYSRDGKAQPGIENAIRDGVDDGERERLRRFELRSGRALAVSLVSEVANPSLDWATWPDGSFAAVDGDIYNVAELNPGDSGSATGHAKAVLAAYLAEGETVLTELDAAAFIVIWDAQREKLLLVRDRWGAVPGFYAELPTGIVWASDIGTVLRGDIDADINLSAFDFFIANGFVPAPWTLAKQVNKIPPAHLLCCSKDGAIELRRYWRPHIRPKPRSSSDSVTESFGQYFEQSLRRRWSSEETTGVLLSGGVDSKLILAGLSNFLDVKPDTFTFHYSDYDGIHNEIAEARRAAEYFGCRHATLTIRPSDIADNLEWMVRSYGQPIATGLHSCMLGDAVNAGNSVLLNGAGADSWYLGKQNYHGLRYSRLPSAVKKLIRASVPVTRPINQELAATCENVIWCGETRFPSRCHEMITPEKFRSTIYSDSKWVNLGRRAKMQLIEAAADDYSEASDEDRIVLLNRQYTNAEGTLYWNHQWGRAHNVAIRFPYVDVDLNDFMLSLPRKGRDKDEIRRFAATLMPEELAYGNKHAQSVPIGDWLRGALKDFLLDQLAPARVKRSDLFDPEGVQMLVDRHLQGIPGHGMTLWAIITTLVWNDLASSSQL